jgi:hypothetical protein
MGATMLRIALMTLTAAAAGLVLAAPANAETPPIAEGVYTELFTRSDGKVQVMPDDVSIRWDCGPDCFRMADRAYRFDSASSRWQADPVATEATCADGSKRPGSRVWWTTNGTDYTGDWSSAETCPEGVPAPLTSVLTPA